MPGYQYISIHLSVVSYQYNYIYVLLHVDIYIILLLKE